jgi:hypothetical protein
MFDGCPSLQRQEQESNKKIIITPVYIRQIHTILSPPIFFSLSGSLLIRFHVKIMYAIFRCPSELHLRQKLFSWDVSTELFTCIYCFLMLHAPPISSHYTEIGLQAPHCCSPAHLSYVNRLKAHVAKEG